MQKDNEQLVRAAVAREMQHIRQCLNTLPGDNKVCGYEDFEKVASKDSSTDGDRMMISISIGVRSALNRTEARLAAKLFRKAVVRYPKAIFLISILGYDDDPRELWEFEDVCRYVRKWARFAGVDDVETAAKYFANFDTGTMGFLAGCGVFGEVMQRQSLTGLTPTSKQ